MSFWGKKKKTSAPPKSSGGGSTELDQQIINLMEQLNIPKSGRDGVLKLPEAQKKQMLEGYKAKLSTATTKKSESGKDWSNKFNIGKSINRKLLQEFTVVIKDSDRKFAEEFIQELGMKRLCRISHDNISFDSQILLIFKAIIDSSQTIIKDIVNDDLTITTIVSKVDSADNRVRELAIKLLVTLVIVEDDDLSLLASSKIQASLLDSARIRGYRNRWKSVITHLSVNEISGTGSFEYDNYALMLINFIISGLETVEERTDERRLLNSLKFKDSLIKLEQSIDETMNVNVLQHTKSSSNSQILSRTDSTKSVDSMSNDQTGSRPPPPKARSRGLSNHQLQLQQYQYCQSVTTQITAYNRFREEDLTDLRKAGIIDDENDLLSPKGLFKVVHDQALDDGYINELTSVLKNLVTIPAYGSNIWNNINKIVYAACKQNQSKYKTLDNKNKNNNNKSENKTYLSFKELQHLLKVQVNEEEKEKDMKNKNNQIEQKLETERKNVSQLEKQVQELQSKIQTLKASGGGGGGLPPPYSGGNSVGLPPPNAAPIPTSSGGLPPPTPVPTATADDKYSKYRQMIKMNMPKQAIVNRMKQGGIDNAIIQKYELTAQLPPPVSGAPIPAPAPLPTASVDDGLNKYRKMIKMNMPKQAIVNRMKQGGIDINIIQKYELTGTLPDGGSGSGAAPIAAPAPAPAPTLKAVPILSKEEEIKVAKYARMKKMSLPEQAIRNKMKQDGIDSALVDKFFGGSDSGSSSGGGGGSGPSLPKPKPKPKWPENLKRKPEIKPSRKMKNLQWTTIDPFIVSQSIWNEVDDSRIKINATELESMFGQKIITKKVSKSTNSRKKKQDVELIHILDGKRSYNVEIFLGRLRMDPFTCKDILLNMDESKFNAEQVSKLHNFVPTPLEAGMFTDLDAGDEKHLAKAERFFYTIRNIDNNLPQRLELWAFKMNFDRIMGVENEKVLALVSAHKCIKTSKSLRELFSVILAIGNYMNGGTKKGQAYGFKLQSLSQLTRSKSNTGKMTLMEYLYLYLEKNNPKLLNFIDEWNSLNDAISVDIPTLRSSISQIGNKLNIINNRCKIAETNSIAGDNFSKIMKPFYDQSNNKFQILKTTHEKVMKDLYELAVFLNEKNDRTGVFLKTLNEFRKQFKFTVKQCNEKQKREEERKKREQWKANKKKGKSKHNNNSGGLPRLAQNESLDETKEKDNTMKPPPPPGPTGRRTKQPTVFSGNKSDQMLAALMRSDSSALMNKLRARRKKNSVANR